MLTATEIFDGSMQVPEAGCWIWAGTWDEGGYARIRRGEARRRVHRLSWTAAHGPIPEGKCVCHKCDTPSCVNPDHLFLGSHLENMQDMVRKGRHKRPAAMVKLVPDQVRAIRTESGRHSDIGERYGISPALVTLIKNRKRWAKVA